MGRQRRLIYSGRILLVARRAAADRCSGLWWWRQRTVRRATRVEGRVAHAALSRGIGAPVDELISENIIMVKVGYWTSIYVHAFYSFRRPVTNSLSDHQKWPSPSTYDRSTRTSFRIGRIATERTV